MFCCMRASVSGLMALLVLWFFPLNIFIHSEHKSALRSCFGGLKTANYSHSVICTTVGLGCTPMDGGMAD